MSNVSEWNVAASSNTSAPPNGAPEGMAPSTVNNTMREMMAALARWYQDANGSLETGGTSNAYTLTTNNTHVALSDIPLLAFRADRANTGAATLNVDGLGAKSIRYNDAALVSGQIVADMVYIVAYNATDSAYDLIGPSNSATSLTAGSLPDGRLSANVPLLDRENTFLISQVISSTRPRLRLSETDADTDEKIWDIVASLGTWSLQSLTDGVVGGASAIVVTRTGTTIDSVELRGTSVTANSAEILTTADEGSGNGLDADTVDGIEAAALLGSAQNAQAGNYTLVLADNGKHIYKASGDVGETITIPANSSVAFPVGACVALVNQGGGDLAIAITTDTLTWAGTGSTGSRTLADDGIAVAIKVATTAWMIAGTGLS